jgi:hypothetical protein
MSQGRPRRASRALVCLVAATVAVAAFGTGTAGASRPTTWLCKPGLKHNPCTPGMATTDISPAGEPQGSVTPKATKKPKVDCFYVYPTVSDQKTLQATTRIDPEERSIALYQAARYSTLCRVFAPMYRQITLAGLLQPGGVTAAMRASSYADVRDAWREYLKQDNHGRGVVLISHSQGTFLLRQLIAKEIDRQPTVRKRLVSAVLLGGNVLVRKGSDHGGDFQNIRACRSATQLGCVIAFSTFNAAPPENAVFGRSGLGRALVPGEKTAGTEVLCTNPAALGGGAGPITSIYPSAPFAPGTTIGALTTQVGMPTPAVATPWIEGRAFTAECSSEGGANALRITGAPGAPELHALPDASWGLHLVDANIALGNLVDVVGGEIARYTAH